MDKNKLELIISLAENVSEFSKNVYYDDRTPSYQTFRKIDFFGPSSVKTSFNILNDQRLCQIASEIFNTSSRSNYLSDSNNHQNVTDYKQVAPTEYPIVLNNVLCMMRLVELNARQDLSIQVKEPTDTLTGYFGSNLFLHTTLIAFILEFYLTQISPQLVETINKVISTAICLLPTPGIFGKRNNRFGLQLLNFNTLLDLSNIDTFKTPLRILKETVDTDNRDRILYDSEAYSVMRIDMSIDRLVIRPNIILSICKQILSTLHILQENMSFIHGNLTVSNIHLSLIPLKSTVSLSTGIIEIDDEFTCKIDNFDLSALTVNFNGKIYRFYQRSGSKSQDWISATMNSDLKVEDVKIVTENKYIIPLKIDYPQYEQFCRSELNIPKYLYPTLDTYTFIISLLNIPEVYYSVFSNSTLISTIWSPLFASSNKISKNSLNTQIFYRLEESIQRNTILKIDDIFTMLKNTPLSPTATLDILNAIMNVENIEI